ncbi:rhomboid family intramembrane serine protease [Aeromicrobium sp. CFBP 8757]|uniref:rhomboid family intramembrane serine protease n=1 Tax=Aeromicrobium sp. CFBP 8757 TaxID=2775288 RepID=UPI001782EFF9|nr:rhomboid family intramembrane serine protease [Aeromicrobium sp. CFBP 8757]MBD8606272.1 rhomboid family intramembrane serine protease [Aeromicrobium sp. CFBP 8757]
MTDQQAEPREMSGPARAGALAVGFVVLLYAVELVDVVVPGTLDGNGVRPRSVDGLEGVALGPLLHGGWAHLLGNTVPLLVLGFLVGLSGLRTWAQVTAIVWVVGGAAVWLVGAPGTVHLGASGLVFGWLSYLVVRGVFSRHVGQIALGVVVFLVYGGLLWGVLPGRPGISWEGHLFGAAAGALAAWLVTPRRVRD